MLEVDLRSRVPIYEQLVERIKELIINNVLKPEEQLPTVRVLASELTINPNTIQKAYRELERRGYVYSIPGKGSFVKSVFAENNAAHLQILGRQLVKIASEMLYLGMTLPEVVTLIQANLPESKGGKVGD